MKTLRRIVKSLLALALGVGVLVGAWACARYGPSEAGDPAAMGGDPGPVTLGESYDEQQLKQALARHAAERAYAEAPRIVNESPVPEGWPALTPVDEVRIKHYPAYRAAVIEAGEQGGTQGGMFRPLFNHIKRRDIAMTAPVELAYDAQGRQESMAFLYRTPDMGAVGSDNADPRVEVRDFPAATALSIGLKGSYSHDRFTGAVARLNAWLDENDQWQTVGEPRYLGYNSPFVPSWMRYGEVQVPVEAVE